MLGLPGLKWRGGRPGAVAIVHSRPCPLFRSHSHQSVPPRAPPSHSATTAASLVKLAHPLLRLDLLYLVVPFVELACEGVGHISHLNLAKVLFTMVTGTGSSPSCGSLIPSLFSLERDEA
jgi:hypothetical protein